MTAKRLAEIYNKWALREAHLMNKELARMFLRMPIPMSYEVWCWLHEQADKELRMTDEPKGLKPLDYTTLFTNIAEPIIIDNPTEQEKWAKKRLMEALEDLPKPKKTGFLMMTPNEDKIKNIKRFENEEISFKCELKNEFGFKRGNME